LDLSSFGDQHFEAKPKTYFELKGLDLRAKEGTGRGGPRIFSWLRRELVWFPALPVSKRYIRKREKPGGGGGGGEGMGGGKTVFFGGGGGNGILQEGKHEEFNH